MIVVESVAFVLKMSETVAFWIIVESFVGPVPSSVKHLLEYLDLCNLGILIPTDSYPKFLDWSEIERQVPKSSEKLLEPCGIKSLTLADRIVCQAIYDTLNKMEEKEFARLMQVCRAIAERKASVESSENFTPPLNRSHFYEIESFWVIVESLIGPVPNRYKMLLQKFNLCNIGMLSQNVEVLKLILPKIRSMNSAESAGNGRFVVSDVSLSKKINTALKHLGQTEFVRNMRICRDVIDVNEKS